MSEEEEVTQEARKVVVLERREKYHIYLERE